MARDFKIEWFAGLWIAMRQHRRHEIRATGNAYAHTLSVKWCEATAKLAGVEGCKAMKLLTVKPAADPLWPGQSYTMMAVATQPGQEKQIRRIQDMRDVWITTELDRLTINVLDVCEKQQLSLFDIAQGA